MLPSPVEPRTCPQESPLNARNKPGPAGRAVDRGQSTGWQAGARPAAKKAPAATPGKRPPGVKPTEVTPDDLECLDAVRSLLSALNNAYASTSAIQTLVSQIPVLAARIVRRIGAAKTDDPALLARALTEIGNMGLESELLTLLEDLTTCRADMEEGKGA
jgi:hypothetical protein